MSAKFEFDVDHQWEIIKYILLDKDGYKALQLVKEDFFSLTEQQLVIHTLKGFFKKKGRIPKNNVNLKYEIKRVSRTQKFATLLKSSDLDDLLKQVDSLYRSTIKDGQDILDNCKNFASFTAVKRVLEDFDISNYGGYTDNIKKLQKAIVTGEAAENEKGLFLVDGWRQRQVRRRLDPGTIPTPFKQLNRSTNSGGYIKGSLITVIDKGKGGKTSFLVNVGRGYMSQRKKIFVADLENGAYSYATRFDQSLIRMDKESLVGPEAESRLSKLYRKYARLGCEVLIHRFPAGTTANQISSFLDEIYSDTGIKFEICIIDYIGLMGSNSGQNDDTARISEAYVDVKNLAEHWGFDIVWTGHHVNREGEKRRQSKYEPNDTAKCIDIHRHVDAMLGLNQNSSEKEAGVFRLEVVDQRDGVGDARAYFWVNIAHQRWDEFSKSQLDEYRKQAQDTEVVKGTSKKGTNTDI